LSYWRKDWSGCGVLPTDLRHSKPGLFFFCVGACSHRKTGVHFSGTCAGTSFTQMKMARCRSFDLLSPP